MKRPRKPKRRCKICRRPERVGSIGGIRFSDIPPRLDICAQCINHLMKS